MQRILCLFWFSLSVNIVVAQNNINLDSLKNIWENPSLPSEERLDAIMYSVIYFWDTGRYKEGWELAYKLNEIEGGKSSKKHQSFFHLSTGIELRARDKAKSELTFQKGIALGKEANFKLGVVNGHVSLGILYMQSKQLDKALASFNEALKLSEGSDNYYMKTNTAWAYLKVGEINERKGNRKRYKEYLNKALNIFTEVEHKLGIVRCYSDISEYYTFNHDYLSALDCLKKVEQLSLEKGAVKDTILFIKLYNQFAHIYHFQENYQKTLEYYFKILGLANSFNDEYWIYASLFNIAEQHLYLEDLDSAYHYTEIYFNKTIEEKNKYEEAWAYCLFAYIDFSKEKYNSCIAYAQDALNIWKAFENEAWGKAKIRLTMGEAFAQLGNFSNAIANCKISQVEYKKQEDKNLERAACQCLYQSHKSLSQFSDALLYLERINEIDESLQPVETAKKLQEVEFSRKSLKDSLAQVEKTLLLEVAHQKELQEKNKIRNIAIGVGSAIFFLAIGLLLRLRHIRKTKTVLEEKNQIIEAEKEKAQASEKAKQQFLANMSHEIRTPMNAIKGMTDILLRRAPKNQQLTYLNAIKESSNSLLVIINDILDMSKIEAGKIDLEAIPFSIEEVIQNVQLISQFKAEEKGLLLQTNIEESSLISVQGDPTRLHQVLVNLVGNAIKFTEKGVVTIQLKTEPGENENQMLAHFCVSDTGVGIGTDRLEKIFDSFEQAYSDTTRKFGGTGLGLSISKKLVELQGGEIWVESEKGKGSQFYFTIPYQVHQGVAEEKSVPVIPQEGSNLKGIKILLVEDNEFNAIVAQEELEDAIEGVLVEVAENGVIAIEKVIHNDFDIVLMDVQMPVMNGYEATQAIRNLSNGKSRIPIIAMTANVMKEEVERCYEAGMDDFIGKPFDTDELLSKIEKLQKPQSGKG